MTDVVVDASMDASLSASIGAALAQIQNTGQLQSLYASGSSRIVTTTRLPDSATILDRATGTTSVTTDAATIAAMITGPHAYIGADSTTVGSASPVVFHWDGLASDGAPIDGSAVVWLGSGFTDGDAVAQADAYYGMTTDVTLVRAIMDGTARAFADEAGGLRSQTGIDHGVGFASMADGLVIANANTDLYTMFQRQGPDGYGQSYGTTGSVLFGESQTIGFSIRADGGIDASGHVSDGEASFSWTRSISAPGVEVLGQTYERYDRTVVTSDVPLITHDDDFGLGIDRAVTLFSSEMGVNRQDQLGAAWYAVHDVDQGLSTLRFEADQGDGAAAALGVSLGLWGFGDDLEFGHTRMVGLAATREINVSDSSLSSGMQHLGGDLSYDQSIVSGYGTDTIAHVMAIDDSATAIDTIIFGAGGSTMDETGSFSTAASVDLIQAGSGSDLIIVGNGVDPDGVLVNVAHGNAGHDVIIGGTGDDDLYGDDGNDLILASDGFDTLHGGAGFDILDASIIGGDTGLVYDAHDGTIVHQNGVTQSDGFERFIGSVGNDVIHAVSGMVVDGNDGADEIHLEGIGIAIGGAGADSFHIDVQDAGNGSFMLLGFDQDDSIWLNGTQHTGVSAVADGNGGWTLQGGFGASTNPDDFWTDDYVAAPDGTQDGLALIRLQHHVSGSVVGTTDIYLAGFHPGEGGIAYDRIVDGQVFASTDAGYDLHMTQTVDDVTALFKGPDYVPQHDMFGLV